VLWGGLRLRHRIKFEITQLLHPVDATVLDERTMLELLAYMAYAGALSAMWRGYAHQVVTYMLHSVRKLVRDLSRSDFPIPFDLICYQDAHYSSHFNREDSIHALANILEANRGTSAAFQSLAKNLERYLNDMDDMKFSCAKNSIVMTASELPSGGARRSQVVSLFTSRYIQGPCYDLNQNYKISLQDAMMWAEVNPFSPLNNGTKINPF
jgi:hypothetical protein